MKFQRALITGASSGIGQATARALAAGGLNLFLVARRLERLVQLKAEIEKSHQVDVQVARLDVRDQVQLEALFGREAEVLGEVDVLINNAGLAKGLETLIDGHTEDWETMIDTNVKGLLFVTRKLLPQMIRHGRGHIVNLGSVAGRWVYPGGGVYCATKFAVRALSEGLRMDLMGTPIRVTNIEPGMVETEFSEVRLGDTDKAAAVYRGMKPLSATDIAETIIWCLDRPAHVNIQELVIFPTDQAAIRQVHKTP